MGKTAILGFGLTGRQMTDYFLQNGNHVTVIDDNNINISEKYLNNLYLNFILEPKEVIDFKEFDEVLLSPSFRLDKDYIKVDNFDNFYTELDYFYPFFSNKLIISVTGTNGKTSTVKLLAELLQKLGKKVFLGGNVGIPLVNYLKYEYDVVVLELSSFQLFYTNKLAVKNFKTDYSILLSLAEDHLSWHKDYAEYIESKLRLIDMTEKDSYVHTQFYDYLKNTSRDKDIKYYNIEMGLSTLKNGNSDIKFKNIGVHLNELLDKDKRAFRVNFIPIQDILYNAGLKDEEKFIELINNVEWEKYRLTRKIINTNIFINDSKSTNIDSTAFALKNFNDTFLILGGDDKGLDYSIYPTLIDKTKEVLIFGGLADKLYDIFINANKTNIKKFKTLNNIFDYLKEKNIQFETILFSPGSSSFDLYKNYIERGKHFDQLIEKYFKY